LERLRQRKQKLKKERKRLARAGLQDTEAYADLSKKWFTLVRKHNNLRSAVAKARKAKSKVAAEKAFKADPQKFSRKLFAGNSKNGDPTFSSEEAATYFSNTYRDECREDSCTPLEGMTRPPPPSAVFRGDCPTKKELARSARSKRNGAASGLNSLSYVPYKKCPVLIDILHKIVRKIWATQDIPESWASAFIVLLSKSEDLSTPSEFRPIAITCTVGKIFFSVVSSRLQKFLVMNNYIKRETQKGFLAGVAGCMEHSFALFEALRNAKASHRQIVVTWIDLANAFGSVRHNLIQFALDWYHVPKMIQQLIFDYYEKLKAKVQTKGWSTGFFLFDIGLFQGCVLSTILFDCVFQLLLDFLAPLDKKLGYTFKQIDVTKMSSAYADDLSIATKDAAGNQAALDRTDVFLEWTKTMRAKPRKCISLAYRNFDPRTDSGKYKAIANTVYAPFDPLLTIAGKPVRFILDVTKDPSLLLHDHFKFLGRWISMHLTEDKVKAKVRQSFREDMELVNSCAVNGLIKLWIYQHYVISHLAWSFLIHDFCLSFSIQLQKSCSLQLKKWAGLTRSADIGCLHRSNANFGLGVDSISGHFKKMQLIKCSILQSSEDPSIRKIYAMREKQVSGFKTRWTPHKLASELKADVVRDLRFQSQTARQGLGRGHFVDPAIVSNKARRKLASDTFKQREQQRMIVHAHGLARQGVWLGWSETAAPIDLSWKNLIYGPGPSLIKFVLNATINTVRTPDMLKLWGYKDNDDCALCGLRCTLHHIISGCQKALKQGRYTWRHDSVLANLRPELENHIASVNSQKVNAGPACVPISRSFVAQGASSAHIPKKTLQVPSLLTGANDWTMLMDLGPKLIFPPEINSTTDRPDIVIYSPSLHKVIIVELTCPAEEGIQAASIRKKAKYLDLITAINKDDANPWTASLHTIEMGARGFVSFSLPRFLRGIGFPSRKSSTLCKCVSRATATCSHAILIASSDKLWHNKGYVLVSPPGGAGHS
jgi:hypothetical protein